ncbi:MAG: diacylglycerol/lipid kinase family protein [Candidatus Limnocylindrales bacterium]
MSIVIWNPNAGQKRRGPAPGVTEESLREILDRHSIQGRIVATESSDAAKQAVREAIQAGHTTIIVAGGDGTIGEVAGELLGKTDIALGILPLGSVMNVARMLGVPREIEAAAAAIAEGRTRVIDVGEANGVIFYETASVGMNAAMFKAAQHFEDGDYGSPFRVVGIALGYRPARMVIELDDETLSTRALMVTISNGAYMGVAMTVAPDARLDDGRFDVRVFRQFSKLELLRHLASIAFGRHRYSPKVSTYRSTRVRITSKSPLPCRADSHDLGTTPLECRCRHAELRVIVGPDYADGRAITEQSGS